MNDSNPTISHKICTKCLIEKPLDEFHKDSRLSDGRRSYCKKCVSKNAYKYRQRPEVQKYRREYKIEYSKRPEIIEREHNYQCEYHQRPEIRKRKRKYKREYSQRPEVQKRHRARQSEYRQRPEVQKRIPARSAVKNAVRTKEIKPARAHLCLVCNEPAREYHHFLGYEKRHHLDLIPLCCHCHRLVDRAIILK